MRHRWLAFSLGLGFALALCSGAAHAQYKLTNLVSNQVGAAKQPPDPLLVNAWGLAYGPGGPFWVSDEKTGWSTLYTGNGTKKGLEVAIPSASGAGPGSPTGVVFNGSGDFQISNWPTFFIFCTLDGTISGWSPQTNPNEALIQVSNATAMYTGLAITSNPSGNFLFAADNANNKIDQYDATYKLVKSFTDPTVPSGFAPFGIQDIDGLLFVAFASQSGAAGGYIDIFSEDGVFLKRLAQGPPLNQPWGFAAAPPNFGPLSNTLLISNNVNNNSTIHAFNALTGQFVGAIKDTNGKPIHIDQLWGIAFGGGTPADGGKNELFFTAGPSNNFAGTFGSIVFKP